MLTTFCFNFRTDHGNSGWARFVHQHGFDHQPHLSCEVLPGTATDYGMVAQFAGYQFRFAKGWYQFGDGEGGNYHEQTVDTESCSSGFWELYMHSFEC